MEMVWFVRTSTVHSSMAAFCLPVDRTVKTCFSANPSFNFHTCRVLKEKHFLHTKYVRPYCLEFLL